MKDLKLWAKLGGSFALIGLIIALVGVVAISQQRALYHQEKLLVTEKMPAVTSLLTMKSEISHLSVIMCSMLTPYVDSGERRALVQKLVTVRAAYNDHIQKFEKLSFANKHSDLWRQLKRDLAEWAKVNNKALALSRALVDLDLTNPLRLQEQLNTFEGEHRDLLFRLSNLVTFMKPVVGGDDPTACELGKWLATFSSRNGQLAAKVKELDAIHKQFHTGVSKTKKLFAGGNGYEAKQVLSSELYPISNKIMTLFEDMKDINGQAYQKFETMSNLLLKTGDSRGAKVFITLNKLVETANAEAIEAEKVGKSIADRSQTIVILGVLCALVFATILGWFLTRFLTRSLHDGVAFAEKMAAGDMSNRLTITRKDETGMLGVALNSMSQNLGEMVAQISEEVKVLGTSSHNLEDATEVMSGAISEASSRSEQVAAATEEMSVQQQSVAVIMEQASGNVNMVATAAEQMNATISEIAQNSNRAKDISRQAVERSAETSNRVGELGVAAREITRVTEAITEISEQTNLLALNATIEAARAGEAGKGFAVVANEIKDLARQTAEATLDIKEKIGGIQQATTTTVKEIDEIRQVIDDVDLVVTTIATAVEEQNVTTHEIAENISQAAGGITEVHENVVAGSQVAGTIAEDIGEINRQTAEINNSSSAVSDQIAALIGVADRLQNIVSNFKI